MTVGTGNRSGTTSPGNQRSYLLAEPNDAIFATAVYDASVLPAGTFGDAPTLVFETPGPYDPVTALLPTLAKSGSTFDFRFRYDAAKTDLIWMVKATNAPDAWPNLLFDSRTSPIPSLDNGWLPVPLPAYLCVGPAQDPRMFVRLEVELVTP